MVVQKQEIGFMEKYPNLIFEGRDIIYKETNSDHIIDLNDYELSIREVSDNFSDRFFSEGEKWAYYKVPKFALNEEKKEAIDYYVNNYNKNTNKILFLVEHAYVDVIDGDKEHVENYDGRSLYIKHRHYLSLSLVYPKTKEKVVIYKKIAPHKILAYSDLPF